ncbi:MAG TPA: TIGR03067 domain-containing protein [Gemmataceae bacterium]|jgi:uncharacterized protein (TIGR03067 family)|nr:TIGR03067 domain-containing protein [Gemmataceae bacterium]
MTTVALLIAALLPGQPAPKDKPADDAARLRGTWAVTASTFDGKPAAADVIKSRKMIFRADELIAVIGGARKEPLKVVLDAGKKPKHIDLARPGGRSTARGIYTLDGDELKLCYAEPGRDRPTEFTSPEGKRLYLLVLKREKESP